MRQVKRTCAMCGSILSKIGTEKYTCPYHGDLHSNDVIVTHVEVGTDLTEKDNHFKGSQRNPWFNQVLEKLAQIHDKKNHDYCPNDENPFFNFEHAAKYATTAALGSVVITPLDVFNILLGIKEARMIALIVRGRNPNNEAFKDTELDYTVYSILREAYKLKLGKENSKVYDGSEKSDNCK